MSIPKTVTFFVCRRDFGTYHDRYTQQSNAWQRIRQVTLLVTLTQSFRSQFFLFFRSGITPTCGGLYWGRGFPSRWVLPRVSTSPVHKKGQVHTLTQNIMTLNLTFHPKIKTHLLGQLNTLQSCATALAVRLAATKTLIVCKALKVTIHVHTITPCQTSHNTKRASLELFSFFLTAFPVLHPSPIASS